MEGIFGQNTAVSILNRLSQDEFQGRTLIFYGPRGVGKWTAATEFSRMLLNCNPFLSTGFLCYRNDDFSLKTRFFLKQIANETMIPKIERYLFTLLGRISMAVNLNESAGKKSNIQELRIELEELLLSGKWIAALRSDKETLGSALIETSDELTKKQKIPIDFVRSLIDFHSQKSDVKYRIGLMGDFENATVEAQNSALKLLEEPPMRSFLILTTSRIESILPTILSRSVQIKFNSLSDAAFREIAGGNQSGYSNTIDWMEDGIYSYSTQKKESVIRFFRQIAPKIQLDNEINEFIETITDESANKLSLKFLEELLEAFRQTHLIRHSLLRGIPQDKSVDEDYLQLFLDCARNTNTAELSELHAMIAELIPRIRYGNVRDKSVFPAALIETARWYQKRSKV